jgi:hypothetical protein
VNSVSRILAECAMEWVDKKKKKAGQSSSRLHLIPTPFERNSSYLIASMAAKNQPEPNG